MTDDAAIDPHSPTWRAVKAFAEDRLRAHRSTLEASGTPIEETEHARGAIAVLNALIALPSKQQGGA